MQRPLSTIIIAFYFVFLAISSFFAGLFIVFASKIIGPAAESVENILRLLGSVTLFFALFSIACSYGLWTFQKWAIQLSTTVAIVDMIIIVLTTAILMPIIGKQENAAMFFVSMFIPALGIFFLQQYDLKKHYVSGSKMGDTPSTHTPIASPEPRTKAMPQLGKAFLLSAIMPTGEVIRSEINSRNTTRIVGRSAKEADIVVDHDSISRAHARLELKSEGLYISDLGSTNGVKIGGNRIAPNSSTRVGMGDKITLGSITLTISSQ